MKLLKVALVAICAFYAVGCQSSVKTAAYVGTALTLREHPNWKPAFQLAYDDLGIIEQAETIGLPEVLAILNRLPVKELKSPEAVIIITATFLIIEETGAPEVNVVTTDKLRPVVKQIRAGMKLALDNHFADYNPDGTLKRHRAFVAR